MFAALRSAYPDAGCALRHGDPFELLAATILSAQCTDERVNAVTGSLLGVSAPTFMIGLLLQWLFAYKLRILPLDGFGEKTPSPSTS